MDVSASVDASEFALQIRGLAGAFLDPEIQAAIADLNGDLVVALGQWGGSWQQDLSTAWWRVRDRKTAEDFAAAVVASRRRFVGNGTSISAALRHAARALDENGVEGLRRIVDISGDGRNNSGTHPAVARDELVAKGITVNGLAILDGDRELGRYFEGYVAGGTASFVVSVADFTDFAQAIRKKLLRELSNPIVLEGGPPGQWAVRE